MSKTFTAKIHLDEEQIREVIAAYFGVPGKKVIVDVDWQGIEIEKEIEVPEQAKPDYIPIPVNPPHDWWNDDWLKNPILHPTITWCGNIPVTLTDTSTHLNAEWTNADALSNKETTEAILNGG